MKYVLFYESAPGVRENAPRHAAAHMARWAEFRTTREAAEEFAAADPFVLEGVVSKWYVRDWNEAIA